jgi:hypothetical protein
MWPRGHAARRRVVYKKHRPSKRTSRVCADDQAPPSQNIAVDAPKVLQNSMKAFSFTTILVLGGGACAAALSAAAMMAAAFVTNESTSVGSGAFCLLWPGGSGARTVPPPDASYDSNLYMLQRDFLDTTNLTGGAAAARAASGSPHSDMYMYSDLLQGSGGEKKIDIPPCVGALGRALAQPFHPPSISIRCGNALRTSGGAAPSPASLPR